MSQVVNLDQHSRALAEQARDSHAGRASKSLVHGEHQRAVLIAMRSGASLHEHETPVAATLHVLSGACTLRAGEQQWHLQPGELVEIPHERHAVDATSDSVVLLTVTI